ncbi:hypothetical protein [Pseudomonas putida]|uniref:hypothetical protein n=1 Tax=Pseudomonas putida TaxID=303 RepID=UPI0009020421|nr:hypothetical protein [Pseudomonas putida]APE97086.1 hypothetical protein BG030_02960 [Pseudomonas putida]
MNAATKGVVKVCVFATSLTLAVTLLSGCIATPKHQSDCEANFGTQGSILTGKRFATSSLIPGIAPPAAYDSLYRILAADGYYIQNADQPRGIISAFQNVNLSDKRAPLNALIESQGNGSKVTLVFIASAGIYTPESGARDEFCRIIQRISY